MAQQSGLRYLAYSLIVIGVVLVGGGLAGPTIAAATTDTTVVEYEALSPQAQQEFDEALEYHPSLHVITHYTNNFSRPAIAREIDGLTDPEQRILLAFDGDYYELTLAPVHNHAKIVLESEPIARDDIPDNRSIVLFEDLDSHTIAYEQAIEKGSWAVHAHGSDESGDNHQNHEDDHEGHETRYIKYDGEYYEITRESHEKVSGQALVLQQVEGPAYETHQAGVSIAGLIAILAGVSGAYWHRKSA